jgi:hypothetical protein
VIARLRRGWTSAANAETYAAYVQATGITDYRRTPGNLGAWMLRRREGDAGARRAVAADANRALGAGAVGGRQLLPFAARACASPLPPLESLSVVLPCGGEVRIGGVGPCRFRGGGCLPPRHRLRQEAAANAQAHSLMRIPNWTLTLADTTSFRDLFGGQNVHM